MEAGSPDDLLRMIVSERSGLWTGPKYEVSVRNTYNLTITSIREHNGEPGRGGVFETKNQTVGMAYEERAALAVQFLVASGVLSLGVVEAWSKLQKSGG